VVEQAPGVIAAHFQLATLLEAMGEFDQAIMRYRSLLERAPDSAPALNNLAYVLAVRKGNLGDALPLAERAYALSPRSGVIVDTLGWLHFMRGDVHRARALLQEATTLEPGVGEIRLHFARVLAALDEKGAARTELSAALDRAPELAERPDVQSFQKALVDQEP
jgi:tetratricopeptide (TPR) repeat protein